MNDDVFHDGERQIQERTGEGAIALRNARGIQDRIPGGARAFVARQEACVCAGRSADGDLWAHVLTGPRGFAAAAEDLRSVDVQIADPAGTQRMPVFAALHPGAPLGMLFIELETRRRLRVNGTIAALTATMLRLAVAEAFPNCPKYIQKRAVTALAPAAATADAAFAISEGATLTDAVTEIIRTADTLFVASAHPDGRLDASHRGGAPGFVRVAGNVLLVPDYPGNSLFNTLGNFAVNPRAGVTVIDFDRGRQLQITGDVELRFDVAADRAATGGTGRWWAFRPRRWIMAPLNPRPTWTEREASPFNPRHA